MKRPPSLVSVVLRVERCSSRTPSSSSSSSSSSSIVAATSALVPDALNHGWRDYGARVGIWRLIDALDRHGIRASALLNSDACAHYPAILEAGRARDWAWLAHGKNNSTLHTDLGPDDERQQLTNIVRTIEGATGRKLHGWMGPALTETFETPRLLRELGLSYVLDWCADDQPFPLEVEGVLSVPYSLELNDFTMFLNNGMSAPDSERAVIDQFEQLHAEGGRVMALALHPFLIGQPYRHKYLERALAHIARHRDVWLTTSDEIARHCGRRGGTGEARRQDQVSMKDLSCLLRLGCRSLRRALASI